MALNVKLAARGGHAAVSIWDCSESEGGIEQPDTG